MEIRTPQKVLKYTKNNVVGRGIGDENLEYRCGMKIMCLLIHSMATTTAHTNTTPVKHKVDVKTFRHILYYNNVSLNLYINYSGIYII